MNTVQPKELSGVISRITFHSTQNHFSVLKVNTPSQANITCVGYLPGVRTGLQVELKGAWVKDKKWGRQFQFESYTVPTPNPKDKEAIITFLTSLKNIKESIAERIYNKFKEETFTIFEEAPEKLLQVKGIGKVTHPQIIESFNSMRKISTLICFLAKIKVSTSYAKRIYEQYGANSVAVIEADPYLLAYEVQGIGFSRADEIALSLGIKIDSPVRIRAGILHTLQSASLNGHCFLYKSTLQNKTIELLSTKEFNSDPATIETEIKFLETASKIINDQGRIYLTAFYNAEVELAQIIKKLANSSSTDFDVTQFILNYEQANQIQLSEGQKEAIEAAAKNKFTVLTGLPGCGKTAVSKAIVEMWQAQGKEVIGVAPTGKAALRLRELTGLESSTIHRLLEWKGQDKFTFNKSNKLEGDCFLADESSMLDIKLASAFFQALPEDANILLVGDIHQLPSVGAGNVLADIIDSQTIPVTKLTQIFRQAATSKIIQAASQINAGKVPDLELIDKATTSPQTDALFWECHSDGISSSIAHLLKTKLPEWGYSPDQIQILSPIHKGNVGNIELNKVVQRVWNPAHPNKAEMNGFREGDRILQTQNDYANYIMNGDIGTLECVDSIQEKVLMRFPDLEAPEGRLVEYEFNQLKTFKLGASISIHKSQGSEFPVVIIPVTMSHYIMLQRTLIYTGLTRAKKLVILVGQKEAIQKAVETNIQDRRNTFLKERLMQRN